MKFPPLVLAAALLVLAGCQPPAKSGERDSDSTLHEPMTTLSPLTGGLQYAVSPETEVKTKIRTIDLDLDLEGPSQVTYLLTNLSTGLGAVNLAGLDPTQAPRSLGSELDPAAVPNRFARLEYHPPVPQPKSFASPRPREIAAEAPWEVGVSTTSFIDAITETARPATLHASSADTDAARTVWVWVTDEAWDADGDGEADLELPEGGARPAHLVTRAMVDALAEEFLKQNEGDVYDWVTGIFGKEWADDGTLATESGSWAGYNLIGGTGDIHLFVSNLNPDGGDNGVYLGYFSWWNNFADESDSNKKILFALDADSLANPADTRDSEDTTWALSDYWPAEIVSTLAHELQHMIHFYQKQVLNNVTSLSDTWINEMSSMVAEDLVADKLGVMGPRGRVELDAGTDNGSEGRLSMFNYFHAKVALGAWAPPNRDTLPNYSQAYGFGSWLLRTYGGPELFRALVQNSRTNYRAVVDAVNSMNIGGTDHTYASLVREWGLATFLEKSSVSPYQYQSGADVGQTSWTLGDETYTAGAIDLGTYLQLHWNGSAYVEGASGPAKRSGALLTTDAVSAGSTFIYDAGQGSGRWQKSLVLPVNVQLTVVVTPVP